jgi:hypothetical protein
MSVSDGVSLRRMWQIFGHDRDRQITVSNSEIALETPPDPCGESSTSTPKHLEDLIFPRHNMQIASRRAWIQLVQATAHNMELYQIFCMQTLNNSEHF